MTSKGHEHYGVVTSHEKTKGRSELKREELELLLATKFDQTSDGALAAKLLGSLISQMVQKGQNIEMHASAYAHGEDTSLISLREFKWALFDLKNLNIAVNP